MGAEPQMKPAEAEGPLFRGRQKKSADIVKDTHTNELVLVLCGPIGSPLHLVAAAIKSCLEERFDYETKLIRLSSFIEKNCEGIQNTDRFTRVKSLIASGDALREKFGGSVLAELAIREISAARDERKEKSEAKRFEPARVCHIIDSVKNQEELDILRLVYRDMLHCIGVVSPVAFRVANMEAQGISQPDIYELIDQDSGEEFSHGQTVRDTFPQADFFLRVDSPVTTAVHRKIERYINIILDAAIETPTPNETAMYLAASAAMSSACLSRQVGAAITDQDGSVIALGWNDVPTAGGGLYKSDPNAAERDMRCKNIDPGHCLNDKTKNEMAESVVRALKDRNVLRSGMEQDAVDIVKTSRLGDIMEFSRAIHAEMHALIIGAQTTGARMVGGKLFCTTYPCHNCARHLIMAGIKQVYYIEPYRKSMATRLHGDAISENESDKDKVLLLPFDGVSPNRYLRLFSMKSEGRKRDGRTMTVNPRHAQLKIDISLESLPILEATVVKNLKEKRLDEAPRLTVE